ncbi:hypothetical protein OQA88_3679 [Cercophora sp. LCS_1]
MAYKHIALITGANQGIGYEIAKKLATEQPDYLVIITGRRKDSLDEALTKLNALGLTNVESLAMDIKSDESIATAAKAVEAKHGRLDVLINNAGVAGNFALSTREMWQECYDVNVIGALIVTNTFIPLLEKSEVTKRVVFMSSGMGSLQDKVDPAVFYRKEKFGQYSSTKSAMNMMALHFAVDYEDDHSWKFNICCPGYCATNLNGFRGTDTPEQGAINAVRLATLGPDGETGTFTGREGPRRW